MLSRRGFTLTELMVALAVGAVVMAAVGRVLIDTHRALHRLSQRIELNHNLRLSLALLAPELRGLDASDPAGSDILEMTDSSLTYKAMRGLYTTCVPASGGRVSLDTASLGSGPLDPEYDSLLLFSDGQPHLAGDDRWLRADLTNVAGGRACPGGTPSLDVTFHPGVAGRDTLPAGSPVRSFEVVQVRRYRDTPRDVWIGGRRRSKATGWGALQPAAGPLAVGGLRFAYFTRDGAPARDPAEVGRVGIVVVGRSTAPVRLSGGGRGHLADSLATQVTLRNNR